MLALTSLRLKALADGRLLEAEVAPDGTVFGEGAGELGVEVEREGGCLRVFVCPERPVRLRPACATLAYEDTPSAVFLNGYNSWTDSVEHRPFSTMPGIGHVPRSIVDEWVLDGSGDYRFTPYRVRPGSMHGFSYAYLRFGSRCELLGSLGEEGGFTLIRFDGLKRTLTAEREAPAREIAAGERVEAFSLGIFEGELDECVDAWLSAAGVAARPAPPLTGYSSWYRHYGDIDAAKLLHDLDGVAEAFSGRELGAVRTLFQIDDGYAKVGDWLEPDPERFGEGMAPLAAAIAARGLIPGIWMAPFHCELDSKLFREHPDWLYRDAWGRPVETGSNWSRAVALDTQKPEVRDYISRCLVTAVRDWGFRFLKLDFLFAACMEPHAGLNRGELMADGLALIREAVGEDTLVDVCGVPLASAFGRAEYCRVGCDVGLDWDDEPKMRILHRERVSTRRSLANTIGRAHLDGRAFGCDPDVVFLREGVALSDSQRTRLFDAVAEKGSMLLTSDDMGEWDEAQRRLWDGALDRFRSRWESA